MHLPCVTFKTPVTVGIIFHVKGSAIILMQYFLPQMTMYVSIPHPVLH